MPRHPVVLVTCLSLLPLLLLAPPAEAAESTLGKTAGIGATTLFPGAELDPTIPTQREVLGFEHGERPVRHREVLEYLRALEQASPRAALRTYTESHEGRELVYLAVSSPDTIAELDAFKREHARRMDPRERAGGDGAAAGGATEPDTATMPAEETGAGKAVAYMAYAIHGDELSSTDAALALAYRLVAGEDGLARRMRQHLVVLIDPLENPDGRERYLSQLRSFAHAEPNPAAEDLSHTGVWPWGRGNHYLFDLNRDWFSLVHPESTRSTVIASWHPQLVVDSHEMGTFDTYLFSPPRHPFNPHLPPSHERWQQVFGDDQAQALDARGYPYYTREWNEEFFPGYGSSWASYHGAIGILYEMSRTSGTLVRKRGGNLRTYAEAVEHQAVSSIANLTTLLEHREAILTDYAADREAAIDAARGEQALGAWVLVEGRHPQRTRRLVDVLRRQGIEVLAGGPEAEAVEGLRDPRSGDPVKGSRLEGALWLVPLDQPAGRLARTILDPHVPMEAAFLREQREHLEKGERSRLYETTAWSLLLSYDVEGYWTKQTPSRDGWEDRPATEPVGRLVEGEDNDTYAYLIDTGPDRSAGVVADLLEQGRRLQVAEKPFRIGGRDYPRGTVIVPSEGNADDLAEALSRAAERWNVTIRATGTAKAERGPDLGGRRVEELVSPRVGVITGFPISTSSYGALWNLLDRELALRFSALDIARFHRLDLQRYNVLVFPPARGGGRSYLAQVGEVQRDRLRRWIEAGGTAIGIGSAVELFADPQMKLTRTRLRRDALDSHPPAVLGVSAETARRAGRPTAPGLRAGPPSTEDAEGSEAAENDDEPAADPYDVAPLVGPGARPFLGERGLPTARSFEPVSLAEWLAPVLPAGRQKPNQQDLERADGRLRRFGPRGVHLRLALDEESWLSWGVGADTVPALVRTSRALIAPAPVEVAARYPAPGRLHLGGLLWPEAAGRLAHTAYAVREAKGRGQVILFVDEPEFRGWTLGTRRLLVNALLYGPGLGTRWSVPW